MDDSRLDVFTFDKAAVLTLCQDRASESRQGLRPSGQDDRYPWGLIFGGCEAGVDVDAPFDAVAYLMINYQ